MKMRGPKASDAEGNAIRNGGAVLSVTFDSVSDANVTIDDLRDGRYLISYIIHTAGTYRGMPLVRKVSMWRGCP